MKNFFLLNLLLALVVSLPGFSLTPKSSGDIKKRKSADGSKAGEESGRSGIATPDSHKGKGPSGPTGTKSTGDAARRPIVDFPEETKDQKIIAADESTRAPEGLKGLSDSPSFKAELDALIKEFALKFNLSEEGQKNLEEAFALLYKQQEIYKNGKDYVSEVKSFMEEFFGKADTKADPNALTKEQSDALIKALADQKIDPAQFAADLILAFRNVPEKLKTEIREIAELLKQDGELAASRIAARNIQVSTYAKAFKAALAENKHFSEAEKTARKAVLDFYYAKGLSEEEVRSLQCECLKTQYSCTR